MLKGQSNHCTKGQWQADFLFLHDAIHRFSLFTLSQCQTIWEHFRQFYRNVPSHWISPGLETSRLFLMLSVFIFREQQNQSDYIFALLSVWIPSWALGILTQGQEGWLMWNYTEHSCWLSIKSKVLIKEPVLHAAGVSKEEKSAALIWCSDCYRAKPRTLAATSCRFIQQG